jgi:ABC-type cobalamin/Fe3+-siderophores transport system ATPase subunit
MKIRITKLLIKNFRGIKYSEISFSKINFLVGDNGTGKTSCLAVIARLMPILRGEKRIFLDGDFLFNDRGSAEMIELTYYFDLISDDQTRNSIEMMAQGTRAENGEMRSHLNDQQVGIVSITFSERCDVPSPIQELGRKEVLTQRIIRNGWGGGRICPISLQTDQRQKHAATSTREESGAFDGLRARLVQKLRRTELGKIVDEDHPNLLSNVLNFTNKFLDELRFVDVQIGYSDMLKLVRSDGSMQPWDGLSGGEQSAFNLAMAIEFSRAAKSQFLIIEEPETTLHPSVQRDFINVINKYLTNSQIFISTHSPYIFENHLSTSNLIIGKKAATGAFLQNPNPQQWLFPSVSWGELSFHAYNLATFEYHNELYGWIQEKTGKWKEKQIEALFVQYGYSQNKQWIRSQKGKLSTKNRTIMTYIRNFTHHPENPNNNMYTESELRSSIENMIRIVQAIR